MEIKINVSPIELWEHIKKTEKDFDDPKSIEHQDIEKFTEILIESLLNDVKHIAEKYGYSSDYCIAEELRDRWKQK